MRRLRLYLSKFRFIVKEEGVGIFFVRLWRFLAYQLRRRKESRQEDFTQWSLIKGTYEGRRAFLIGNGPSLNQTELYALKDEFTLCFNRVDLLLERLDWVPSAYAVSDDRVLLDIIDVAKSVARSCKYAFFPDIHPSASPNVNFRKLLGAIPNVYWLYLSEIGFSDQLPYCGLNKSVANVGLQILSYLGFKQIYILGVDLDYGIPEGSVRSNRRDIMGSEDNDTNHFDPRYFGKGRKYHVPRLEETFLRFQEAARFFQERNVRIVNSTRGGKLDAFPRIPLTTVLNLTPERKREFLDRTLRARTTLRMGVDEILRKAVRCSSVAEFPTDSECCVVSSARISDFISECIATHVPFGPLDQHHILVRRDCVTPPSTIKEVV